MSESTVYVAYNVAQQQKGGVRREGYGSTMRSLIPQPGQLDETVRVETLTVKQTTDAEPKGLLEFLNSRNPKGELIESFTDNPETRRTAKWPQLQKALELCKQRNATLLIIELGTLTGNESFTQLLLASGVAFHCLDQPFVTQTILEALSKHAEVQRKLHGKLIREGLKLTSAKSGNPNAAEVISKVNKPKIDTAIVFAFLLQPIIQDYRRKGYSQRQMVKTLNEEGFTAPEGGKWVLSQLQKVLDRVRLNEIATELTSMLDGFATNSFSSIEMAEALNSKAITSLKPPTWDATQVKKLQERIQQIQDIVLINQFVLDLLPLLHEYRRRDLSPTDVLMNFQQAGIKIRQAQEGILHSHPDKDLKAPLDRLKQDINDFKEESANLELAFESAAKHMPVYLKIVKSHIEQLATVLELETHNNRNLDTVGLAEPVKQLMKLFRALQDEDIQLLETLAFEARNWPIALESTDIAKKVTSTVTET